ncbi:MAG: hypothetical protein Q8P22_07315 [Chloroflexota bacterium]|nr:hypothetical protein [Chloroflexota bacterium]
MRKAAVLLLGLVVAVGVVLLTSACGGGGEEKASPTPSARATGTAAASPAARATGTPAASSLTGAAKDLYTLASKGTEAIYKATYKISSTTQGESSEGTMAIYSKPPKSRFDSTSTIPGQTEPTEGRFISTNGDSITCSKTAGEWTCTKFPAGQAFEEPSTAVDEQEVQKYDVSKTDGRKIAGQSTDCFLMRPKPGQTDLPDETELCLNGDGIPLYSQAKGPGADATVVEATDYSGSVSDADFQPPAEPQALP